MAISVLTAPRIVSFAALFVAAKIRRGSRSWTDYEFGKHLLKDLPAEEYERGIKELTEYLGL